MFGEWKTEWVETRKRTLPAPWKIALIFYGAGWLSAALLAGSWWLAAQAGW